VSFLKELVPILPKDDLTKLILGQAVGQLSTASNSPHLPASIRVLMKSGAYAQKSVPASKRGASMLRKTLFQVMML